MLLMISFGNLSFTPCYVVYKAAEQINKDKLSIDVYKVFLSFR